VGVQDVDALIAQVAEEAPEGPRVASRALQAEARDPRLLEQPHEEALRLPSRANPNVEAIGWEGAGQAHGEHLRTAAAGVEAVKQHQDSRAWCR
jgi:hypothetical protein